MEKKISKDEFKKALPKVMDSLIKSFSDELFAKKQSELDDYYYYKYDPDRNIVLNTYDFFDKLELYRSHVSRWEEHHNGCCCVVERVRDKYLLPKIAKFWLDLKVITENNNPAQRTEK